LKRVTTVPKPSSHQTHARHETSDGPMFEYIEPIDIQWVRPEFGLESGGTKVPVVGDGMHNDSKLFCQFRHSGNYIIIKPKIVVQAVYVNASAVTCITPEYEVGICTLSLVYDETIQEPLSANGLHYSFLSSAQISSIDHVSGQRRGRARVTLKGNHFIYSPHIQCRFVPHPAKLLSRGCSKVPKRSSVVPPQ
jgi:hypothetical protein